MPIPPSPAVLRACDVLGHLAAHPSESFSVSELARSVGAARASCDSVLVALASRGLVYRDADLRYTLGPACRDLGDAAQSAGAPLIALEPIADGLARATAACVAIASCSRGETRVERVFDHGPVFGVRTRVGESIPLIPPFGAVFVAWQGDAAIDGWLDRSRAPLAVEERAHAHAALAAVRRRGYSISVAAERPDAGALDARAALRREITPSEYLPVSIPDDTPQRVTQMSAPVFDGNGEVVYALMVLGPSYDIDSTAIAALGDHLLAAARSATTALGGRHT